jgi:hypothetical protein
MGAIAEAIRCRRIISSFRIVVPLRRESCWFCIYICLVVLRPISCRHIGNNLVHSLGDTEGQPLRPVRHQHAALDALLCSPVLWHCSLADIEFIIPRDIGNSGQLSGVLARGSRFYSILRRRHSIRHEHDGIDSLVRRVAAKTIDNSPTGASVPRPTFEVMLR